MRIYISIIGFFVSLCSYSQINSLAHSDLVNFYASECIVDSLFRYQERIVRFENDGEKIMVDLTVVSNCCDNKVGYVGFYTDTLILGASSTPTIEVTENGDTLFETDYCMCNCLFDYSYEILIQRNVNHIYFGDKKLKLLPNKFKNNQYKIISGDTVYNCEYINSECYCTDIENWGYMEYCFSPTDKLNSIYMYDYQNKIESITMYDTLGLINEIILGERKESGDDLLYKRIWWDNRLRLHKSNFVPDSIPSEYRDNIHIKRLIN